MLACSQHTAHLLQKSNHFGPKQSKSRQADLRWGLTWARLRQQSIRFKWFNHEYNFLQAQELLQPGSWSLQIVTKNAARCTWPQHSIPLAISSKQSSASRSLHYQEFAQGIYWSIYHPSKRGVEDTFPPNIATSRGLCFFGGWYLCTSSEKKDKTLFGEAQPQCHHQHLVILKAPKNINHLHIAVTKMPNGRHYQYCKIR